MVVHARLNSHKSFPLRLNTLPGKLIVFEGPDGVGKTTLSQRVCDYLRVRGIRSQWLSFPGKEAGSLGKLIYDLHHQPECYEVLSMTAAAKQALHIAAHLDAIERQIIPWLAEGIHVVMDRYWWSTWVYGVTDGLNPALLQGLINVEKISWGVVKPTMLFLVETEKPRAREDDNLAIWYALKQAYRELSHQEQTEYPVLTIVNTAAVEETMRGLSESLQRIIP